MVSTLSQPSAGFANAAHTGVAAGNVARGAVRGGVSPVVVTRGAVPAGAVGTGARAASLGVAEAQAHHQEISGEEKAANVLSKVRHAGFAAWMPGWMTIGSIPLPLPAVSIFAGIAGLLASGASKLGWEGGRSALSSVQSSAKALMAGVERTLERVNVNNIKAAPGEFLRVAGGTLAQYNNAATQLSPRLKDWAMKVDGELASKVVAPPRELVASVAGNASAGAEAARGSGVVGKVFSWRANRAAANAVNIVENAEKAFGQAPRGLLARIMRRAPAAVTMPTAFQEAFGHVTAAKGQSGAQAVEALKKASELLAGHAQSGVPEVAKHAASVGSQVDKAIALSSKAVHFDNVAKGGFGAWMKSAANGIGNMKLKTAILGTAVLAGTGVAFLTARSQGKKEAAALAEFKADAGADSALAKSTEHAVSNGAIGRYAGATFAAASEGLMLHKNPMSMLMPQMALGMVGGQLGGQSHVLAAHQALKNAEAGKLELGLKDKFDAVKILVAAVPAVEAHGGIYNRLTSPVAAAIVERNMPVKQILNLLNDPTAFNAFAAEVKGKIDAAAKSAPAAAIHAKTPTVGAATSAKQTHNAAAPLISAGAQHQGVVTNHQRSVAS